MTRKASGQYAVRKSPINMYSTMVSRQRELAANHAFATNVMPEVNGRPAILQEFADPRAEVVGEIPRIGKYVVYFADRRKEVKRESISSPVKRPEASPLRKESTPNKHLAAAKRGTRYSPSAFHGGPWTHVGKIESDSSPGLFHTISVNTHGELGCDCKGYILHHSDAGGKTCKHCQLFARGSGGWP